MTDQELEQTLRALDASFDAALARQDEIAAQDLAYSLLQDLDLPEALRRWTRAEVRIPDGGALPVEEVGSDFLVTGGGTVLIPIRRAVLIASSVAPALALTDEMFVERLRAAARTGVSVQVRTYETGTYSGKLARVCRDHIEVAGSTGRAIITSDAIASVKICRGG